MQVGHPRRGILGSRGPRTCVARTVSSAGAHLPVCPTSPALAEASPDLEPLRQTPIKARLPLQPYRVRAHTHDLQSQGRVRAALREKGWDRQGLQRSLELSRQSLLRTGCFSLSTVAVLGEFASVVNSMGCSSRESTRTHTQLTTACSSTGTWHTSSSQIHMYAQRPYT